MKTKEKGITLVALVITVIILLILAGVAISLITGGDALFGKTKEAGDKYNNAAKNEAEMLNQIISDSQNALEPDPNGKFSVTKGVNTPDTSKLPVSTTKYVTWTGTDTFTEVLSDKKIANWYDYKNSKWANIKTTSTDGSLEAYWVWIPRFAYKLPESATAKTIEVGFVKDKGTTVINPTTGAEEQAYYATDNAITTDGSGIYVKKTSDAASKWIIHPAFSFGNSAKSNENTQLSGIWVAKYEASSSNPSASNGGDNTTALKVQVKPNVTSWRNITAANSFANCRAIQNEAGALGTTGITSVDTHMMKNMEWGAVAILSQSKYGNYDKATNTNVQVWNNPNSSYITGSAGDSKDLGSTSNASCYAYNTTNGIKASTTGNVYGVYDMAGGAGDILSGLCAPAIASNILGTTELKYYDAYMNPNNIYTNYDGGKIGDVTRELLPGSQVLWNGDRAYFVESTNVLNVRGGTQGALTAAGVFAFAGANSNGYTHISFRPTLVII